MLRSQSDVKFDTGDKEESGCLSANPALGLRWVLVPSETGAEEEQSSRWLAARFRAPSCGGRQWVGSRGSCQWVREARICPGSAMESRGSDTVFTERLLFVCYAYHLSVSKRDPIEVL